MERERKVDWKWVLVGLVLIVVGVVIGRLVIPAPTPAVETVFATPKPTATPNLLAALATRVAELSEEVRTLEREEPTPTPVPPTVTPTSVPSTPTLVPPSSGLVPYEQEGGIPWSGAAWSADVAPDEIEVLTAGPASIAGVTLPGGVDRGSVIILLPDPDKVVQYTVTGLVTGANWHGSYRPLTTPNSEATWRTLAKDRVTAMQQAPNCTSGLGCAIVDVLVVGPEGVVARWVVQ